MAARRPEANEPEKKYDDRSAILPHPVVFLSESAQYGQNLVQMRRICCEQQTVVSNFFRIIGITDISDSLNRECSEMRSKACEAKRSG